MNQQQIEDLLYVSRHVLVSVAIQDSPSKSSTFLEHEGPKTLVELYVEELERRHTIIEDVEIMYPRLEDFDKGLD